MVEAVAVVTGGGAAGRVDEAAARRARRALRPPVPRKVPRRRRGELASDDRRSLQHRPLRVGEPAEPAGEHRLERRREALAALGGEGGELLGVQGISLGERDDTHHRLLVELRDARHELARLLVGESTESDLLAGGPCRAPGAPG